MELWDTQTALAWRRAADGESVAAAPASLRPSVTVDVQTSVVVSVAVWFSSSTLQPTIAVQVDCERVIVVVRVPEVVTVSDVVVAQMSAVLVLHCSGWLVGYVTLLSFPMLQYR